MEPQIALSLYRAITGRHKSVNRRDVFEGVSEEELNARGIFCENFSVAQTRKQPSALSYDRFIICDSYLNNRNVFGLPVFLNLDEAEWWLQRKTYEREPAIVEAKIPIEILFGNDKKVRLVRNGFDERLDYEPTEVQIREHISGREKIRGESFIEGIGNSDLMMIVRQNETMYRPVQRVDERIVLAKGYRYLASMTPDNISVGN